MKQFNELEPNTKILIAILGVITLPLTIPLLIITISIFFGIICFIIGIIATYPVTCSAIAIITSIVYYRLRK